jgi:alpha-D-ribose 1-methylphosphonate 5-triphosphate diphosphatase PhnM
VIQKKLHLETLRTFSSPNLFLMKITDHTPVKDMIKSLSKYNEVKYAEPNYKMSIDSKKGKRP